MLNFNKIGSLKTRTAHEVSSSLLSVGCETLDRGYAVYDNYKEYVHRLGVKRVRLQTGWAKFEQVKGEYNYAWYDDIVDDLLSRGVTPWLNLMYGNPIYENGGGATLEIGGLPTGAEAVDAWLRWTEQMVLRYKDRVKEWEIWNEPDIRERITGLEYAEFFVKTAEVVRKADPNARIIGLSLAGIGNLEYITDFFEYLKKEGKLSLIDVFCLHGYPENPDINMNTYALSGGVARRYCKDIEIWCGECGAPSKGASFGALSDMDVTETVQAKWNMRRAMWLIPHGILFNVFTMIDLHYPDRINYKGLLETNDDMTVKRPKPAFHAINNIASIFDDGLTPVKINYASFDELSMQLYAYNSKKGNMFVYWDCSDIPMDGIEIRQTTIKLMDLPISSPVLIDLMTGDVYEPNKSEIMSNDLFAIYNSLPLCDYPLVIAERDAVCLI